MRTLAIVTDLTLAEWVGGGTLVNEYVAHCARQDGWNVVFLRNNAQTDEWQSADHDAIDAYFVANIPFMPVGHLQALVHSGKPYVMFRHDISSICYAEAPHELPAAGLVSLLFNHAKANIFISHLQLQYYQRVCHIPRSYVIPPPLDLQRFTNEERADRRGQLYIGEISIPRGIEETLASMQSRPDHPREFYGQLSDTSLLPKLKRAGALCHPAIDHGQVPSLLNQFKVFHYHPRIVDAFCLKVVEAELCGLTLDVRRENIGRFTYAASALELQQFMRQSSPGVILDQLRSP